MIKIKAGVKLDKLEPQMALALPAVAAVYDKYGYDTIITSGNDGKHSNTSLHYVGHALDFRTRHVKPDDLSPLVSELQKNLGDNYDVVLESTHIHAEFDPR